MIEKQSEENTDAESSEAIVAADVSKEAPATKEEVTSEDEDAEDLAMEFASIMEVIEDSEKRTRFQKAIHADVLENDPHQILTLLTASEKEN